MAENENSIRPIVVKRPKKGGGGHHGGSWKVAYADFVTAMMAFFLLLWILETSDMQTRESISDHFQSPSMVEAAGGASLSLIDFEGAHEAPRGEGGETLQRDPQQEPSPTEESRKRQSLGDLMSELEEQIQEDERLEEFEDDIVMEIDEEGLRVQLLDRSNRPMFRENSASLHHYARDMLEAVGGTLGRVTFRIVVAGHTASVPYEGSRSNYNNWDLSSDRANAARRALINGGLPENRIERVTGLADTVPYDARNPMDPVNRRISILVTPREVELRREAPQRSRGSEFLEGLSRDMLNENEGGGTSGRIERGGGTERDSSDEDVERRLRETLTD
ncbi:MAG: flagellar motor protein MotB [Pseudomonadota bacterium]